MEFYNNSVTRMVATALMDFLARISIEKFKTISISGADVFAQRKIIPVPIQWATKEKWVEIVRSSSSRKAFDPAIREKSPVEMMWILPRISCNLTGLTYNSELRLTKTQQVTDYEGNGTLGKVFTPAPYILDFEVSSISRHLDDNLQIMEQILPYFAPTLSLSLNLYDDMETESVPFTLTSVSMDNPTDIPEFDERIFTNVYSFQAKVNYYTMKKFQKYITHVDFNLQAGTEIVNIQKSWNDLLGRCEAKFNYYVDNSARQNPFINIQFMTPEVMLQFEEKSRYEVYQNMIEMKFISETLSGLPYPFIHALQDPVSGAAVYLTTDVTSANQYNYPIFYRTNLDSTIRKYEEPIPLTLDLEKIYCWTDFTNMTTVSQFGVYIYDVINGVGYFNIIDPDNITNNEFTIG